MKKKNCRVIIFPNFISLDFGPPDFQRSPSGDASLFLLFLCWVHFRPHSPPQPSLGEKEAGTHREYQGPDPLLGLAEFGPHSEPWRNPGLVSHYGAASDHSWESVLGHFVLFMRIKLRFLPSDLKP